MAIDEPDVAEIQIMVTSENGTNFLSNPMSSIRHTRAASSGNFLATPVTFQEARRSLGSADVKDGSLERSRSHSGIVAVPRQSVFIAQRNFIMELFSSRHGSTTTLNAPMSVLRENHIAHIQRVKNRRLGK